MVSLARCGLYSNMDNSNYEEKFEEASFVYTYKNIIYPPLDYSFLHLVQDTDLYDEEPRRYKMKRDAFMGSSAGKSLSRCLKLNNNALTCIENLPKIIDNIFESPSSLSWIDLSFNKLNIISSKLLSLYQLQILYLHGNLIEGINEVDKLHSLEKLSKLTLHGNPMENVKGYRQYVLSKLPQLIEFDFSVVTRGDISKTLFWSQSQSKSRKLKKKINI